MDAESFVTYLALAAIITLTPGPNMTLVIRTALGGGTVRGIGTTLGVATGLMVWAGASVVGLAAIVATTPELFAVLQLGGGAWLVFLGLRSVRAPAPTVTALDDPRRLRNEFRAGLFTNLLNPLVGVFYLTVLPGFVAPSPGAPAMSLLLAAVHIGMVLVWLSACSVLVGRAAAMLTSAHVRVLLQRIAGVALIAFGVRAIASVVFSG